MKYGISNTGRYSIDLKFKNILRISSALNSQKNKNTQPGSEKQYCYKKEYRVAKFGSIQLNIEKAINL